MLLTSKLRRRSSLRRFSKSLRLRTSCLHVLPHIPPVIAITLRRDSAYLPQINLGQYSLQQQFR